MRVVDDTSWDFFIRRTEASPFFVSLDIKAHHQPPRDRFSRCARVSVKIAAPLPSGGPGGPEATRLADVEDGLCDALETGNVSCRLLARVTHDGRREWVFAAEEARDLETLAAGYLELRGLDAQLVDGDWDYFDTLRPDPYETMWMQDAKLVDHLLRTGSEAGQPCTIEFVFVGDKEPLGQVARALSGGGFERVQALAHRLVMSKVLPLDPFEIAEETSALHALASKAGVTYDGWGAATER